MSSPYRAATLTALICLLVALGVACGDDDTTDRIEPGTQPGPQAGEGGATAASGAQAPDVISVEAAADVIERIEVDAPEFASGLVEKLVPGELSGAQESQIIEALIRELVPEGTATAGSESDQNAALVKALVRRLGPESATLETTQELLAALAKQIDPEGTIQTPEQLIATVAKWAESRPTHVLIVAPPDRVTGALKDLSSSSFDTIAELIREFEGAGGDIEVPLVGVSGLDDIRIPGVEVSIDEPSRSIAFSGTADVLSQNVNVLLAANWGDGNEPTILLGILIPQWSLGSVGFSGPLSDHGFGTVAFAVASSDMSVPSGELNPVAREFFAGVYGDQFTLEIARGLNMAHDHIGRRNVYSGKRVSLNGHVRRRKGLGYPFSDIYPAAVQEDPSLRSRRKKPARIDLSYAWERAPQRYYLCDLVPELVKGHEREGLTSTNVQGDLRWLQDDPSQRPRPHSDRCGGSQQITCIRLERRQYRVSERPCHTNCGEQTTGIDGASFRDDGPRKCTGYNVPELIFRNRRELLTLLNGKGRARRRDLQAHGRTRLHSDEISLGNTGSTARPGNRELDNVTSCDGVDVIWILLCAGRAISKVPFYGRD